MRRDLQRLLRAVDTRYMFEAAEALRGFDKPALVLWAEDDKLFPLDHGRRLAELLPRAGSRRVRQPHVRPGGPAREADGGLREFLAGEHGYDSASGALPLEA